MTPKSVCLPPGKLGEKKQMRGTGTIVLLRSTITNEDMSIWKANRNFVGEMRIEERFEEKGKRKREKAQFWAFFFFAGLGITPVCVCAAESAGLDRHSIA